MSPNLLLDALPEEIDGVPIVSDFRRMIQFELLLQDEQVAEMARIPLALRLLYPGQIPPLEKAVNGLLWFYRCGAPSVQTLPQKKPPRAYDFAQDASLIYAAFWQIYQLDLNQASLHWWQFHALFCALPEDCSLMKIMRYRTTDLSTLKGEEKTFIKHMQAKYRLSMSKRERLPLQEVENQAKAHVLSRFQQAEQWTTHSVDTSSSGILPAEK
mgnify:CR=1 FL=1